jgi:hypothetical protein
MVMCIQLLLTFRYSIFISKYYKLFYFTLGRRNTNLSFVGWISVYLFVDANTDHLYLASTRISLNSHRLARLQLSLFLQLIYIFVCILWLFVIRYIHICWLCATNYKKSEVDLFCFGVIDCRLLQVYIFESE